MNIFNFLVLILSICLFLLAFHMYREYQKNAFHRLYIRLFATCGVFVFFLFLLSNSSSKAEARFWIHFLGMSHLIFPFITHSLLHLYPGHFKINHKAFKIWLYTPFLVFFFLDTFFPSLTYDDPKLTPYGWIYINKAGLSVYSIYSIVYFLNLLFQLVLIFFFYFKEKNTAKRRFLLFFTGTFLLPFGLFLLLNFILDRGTTYLIPFLAIIGMSTFLTVILFLRKFSIFDISMSIAPADIARNMPNMLFLLDKDLRIVKVNPYACRLLSYNEKDIISTSFHDLIHPSGPDPFSLSPAVSDSEVFIKSRDNRYIPAYISVTKVKRREMFLGYMVLGNDLSKIYKLSGEKKILQLELKALQSQMNPHFVFNALNSIMVLISERDEIKANEYISCLSNLIRRVMENVNKELVTIDEEIELLRSYIAIESLRFGKGFHYTIEKKGITSDGVPVFPPMIIQPFVENAIWHGLLPMKDDEKKNLKIRFEKKKNKLAVSITDNGVGRLKAHDIKSSKHQIYNSQGIRNIEERIRLYNSFSDHLFIDLQINDLFDVDGRAAGTEVKLHFDLINNK